MSQGRGRPNNPRQGQSLILFTSRQLIFDLGVVLSCHTVQGSHRITVQSQFISLPVSMHEPHKNAILTAGLRLPRRQQWTTCLTQPVLTSWRSSLEMCCSASGCLDLGLASVAYRP